MRSHELSEPSSPQERLTAAKAAFRHSILQNDTVFSLLHARLSEPNSAAADLPDFGLEPTLHRNDDGTSIIGLRINRSATAESDDMSMSAAVSVYDYLPLGLMDRTTGETRVTPELEAALTAAGKDTADALGVWQAWQAGIGEMGARFSDPLTIDTMTDTFKLRPATM